LRDEGARQTAVGKEVCAVINAVGFFFLCTAPGLTRAQSSPPGPAPTPRKTSPAARPKKNTPPPDDFAGFQYTDEQQARIDQIHQDVKSRRDAVVKDEKLTAEQRDAMLAGYQRMERSQVYKVLNSQQRKRFSGGFVPGKRRRISSLRQSENRKVGDQYRGIASGPLETGEVGLSVALLTCS
jgi:hypothetical protein